MPAESSPPFLHTPFLHTRFCRVAAPALALLAGAGLALGPLWLKPMAKPAEPPSVSRDTAGDERALVEITGSIAVAPPLHLAGPLPVTVTQVIDGDTVEARVQVWLGQDVVTRVRLRGIDAPEIAGACGEERQRALAARDRLAALTAQGPLTLTDIGRDKYFGRVVARLMNRQGGDLGRMLLREGLARPYQGGRRDGWCRFGN
ncbi:MAG: thermonuclease family protein [Beijerinckiaceae bacterium]